MSRPPESAAPAPAPGARWAPAPVPVDASAGRSSSRLDAILGASLVGRCRDASAGFGVMHPFRSVGEVFGAVPPGPVPLTKSYSAPAGPCFARGAPDGGPLSVEALFFQADQALGGETGGGIAASASSVDAVIEAVRRVTGIKAASRATPGRVAAVEAPTPGR